jgi:hypothetical protein
MRSEVYFRTVFSGKIHLYQSLHIRISSQLSREPMMRRFLLTLVASLPALALPISTHAAGLNDTGIGFCGDTSTNTAACATGAADSGTFPRQDARYGRDAAAAAGHLKKVGEGEAGFDFTALDATGKPTTPSSGPNPHTCARDNTTGLIWEVKTGDGGLRDLNWTYTWYDSAHNYGGNHGMADGGDCKSAGRCDSEKYVADVNATALCGYSDWRMPTIKELEGIVHFGQSYPAIDSTYFPNTLSSSFWTSTPCAYNSDGAWYVYFGYGYANVDGRSDDGNSLRLVRGGK